MQRTATFFFAGLSLTAIIVVVIFWNELRASQVEIAELRQSVAQLETGRAPQPMRGVPPGAVRDPAGVLTPATSTSALPSPGATEPARVATASPSTVPASTCERILPLLLQAESLAGTTMASELKLSPAETQRFTEIRNSQLALAQGCSTPDAATPEQLQAQMEAALGPARHEQLQEILAARSTQANMTTLSGQVAAIGAPLDDEQARQLSATILEENRRSRRQMNSSVPPSEPYARLAYEEQNLEVTTQRHERVLAAAQAYLKPPQLELLRGNLGRQREQMRSNLARLRTSIEAGGGIPASPPQLLMLPGAR